MNSKNQHISRDGSIKHLIEMSDGLCVEAVWIPQHDGVNLCISSQVGCPNKCLHCATGSLNFERDMTCNEIVSEVQLLIETHGTNNGTTKILFMGMGEPFLNYENVLSSIKEMVQQQILDSFRSVIISTSGIVPGIERLAKEDIDPKLAITIAAAPDRKREKLIPITKIFCLDSILSACHAFQEAKKEDIIFEIPLIGSFNDSIEDAYEIVKVLKNFVCEIQVIPFNNFCNSKLGEPERNDVTAFINVLKDNKLKVVEKPSYGGDIYAGCGQLSNIK